jgi:hypothetical protein
MVARQHSSGTGDKGLVLAKAGIKTPPYARTESEQNEYVEQFLTRTPGKKFIIETQTTYREIKLFHADLVTKRSERAISMEYDFERRPAKACETPVEHARSTAIWLSAPSRGEQWPLPIMALPGKRVCKKPLCHRTNLARYPLAVAFGGIAEVGSQQDPAAFFSEKPRRRTRNRFRYDSRCGVFRTTSK